MFFYSVLKSSWGIRIGIEGRLLPHADYDGESTAVADGVFLASGGGSHLSDGELGILKSGVQRVAPQIVARSPFGKGTLIELKSVLFDPCDYQEEGLEPAIVEWASDQLAFDAPEYSVEFDKEHNRYIFEWAGAS